MPGMVGTVVRRLRRNSFASQSLDHIERVAFEPFGCRGFCVYIPVPFGHRAIVAGQVGKIKWTHLSPQLLTPAVTTA